MRAFVRYERLAQQAQLETIGPGMFYDEEDPDQPCWALNRKNMAAFESVALRPRVMVDLTSISLSTEILGRTVSFPVLLAPAGWLHRLHPDGDLAVARAAGSVGTALVLSTASSFSMEDVAQAASTPMWFQLYPMKDRKLTEHLVQRAEAAGYAALAVTIDNPAIRPFEWDDREVVGSQGTFGNFDKSRYPDVPLSREELFRSRAVDFQWTDLEWLRSITRLPIVLKGIQTAEDAILAGQHGVQGVVVSNHGGHTIPGVAGTLTLLPEIADVAGRMEVYIDGGIRSGSHVLKALALGARAVLIGRPMAWGLIVNGEAGVREILEALRDELSVAAGLCGITDVRAIDRSYVSAC